MVAEHFAAPKPGETCALCGQRKPDEGAVPFHLVIPLSAELDATLTDDDRKLITQTVAGVVMRAMSDVLAKITHRRPAGIYVPRPPGVTRRD